MLCLNGLGAAGPLAPNGLTEEVAKAVGATLRGLSAGRNAFGAGGDGVEEEEAPVNGLASLGPANNGNMHGVHQSRDGGGFDGKICIGWA